MRYLAPTVLLGLSIAVSTPTRAQVPDWVNQILTAAQLPVATAEARKEGANNEEIRAVLDAMKNANVPAHEATAVIDTARAVRREHGPVDNFGAFVQAQLAAGKRGRDLAAAIRAEHKRAGKGKSAHSGAHADSASDTAAGRGNAKPKPADRGRGKPTKPNR